MDKQAIIDMRIHGIGLENNGQVWSEDDSLRIKIMYEQGYGISEMAHAVKRSESATYQRAYNKNNYNDKTKKRGKRRKHEKKCLCMNCHMRNKCPHGSTL